MESDRRAASLRAVGDQWVRIESDRRAASLRAVGDQWVRIETDRLTCRCDGPHRDSGAARSHIRPVRSEEHTSELQSRGHLVCRLLLEKKKRKVRSITHTETINCTC